MFYLLDHIHLWSISHCIVNNGAFFWVARSTWISGFCSMPLTIWNLLCLLFSPAHQMIMVRCGIHKCFACNEKVCFQRVFRIQNGRIFGEDDGWVRTKRHGFFRGRPVHSSISGCSPTQNGRARKKISVNIPTYTFFFARGKPLCWKVDWRICRYFGWVAWHSCEKIEA